MLGAIAGVVESFADLEEPAPEPLTRRVTRQATSRTTAL